MWFVCLEDNRETNTPNCLNWRSVDIYILNINFPYTFIVPSDLQISRHPLGIDYDLVFITLQFLLQFPIRAADVLSTSSLNLMLFWHWRIWYSDERASWYILIMKPRDALISQIYFWNKSLHVSDSISVHHQEFSTVHTAIGICHTGFADSLLAICV